MNISYKERQITLFPDAVEMPDESKRPQFMAAQLTLSIENLVILTIVSIMVILFAFAIGMERGKRVALLDVNNTTSVGKVVQEQVSPDPSIESRPFWQGFWKKGEAVTSTENVDVVPATQSVQKPAGQVVVKAVAKVDAKASGSYTIQIASYKTKKGAQQEASTLKQKGYRDVFVLSKGSYVILCVGSFQKKEEASLFGKKLKGRYQDLRVRSL